MKMKVHHVGIIVDDIDKAKKFYTRVFERHESGRYIVKEANAEVCFIPFENTYVELVKPLADDGLARFLKKRGSGTLHHICYIVDDIDQAYQYFTKEKGLRSITGEPQPYTCFEKAVFFDPKDTDGVLIELVSGALCPLPTLG